MNEKKDDLITEIKEIEKMDIKDLEECEAESTINGGYFTVICC